MYIHIYIRAYIPTYLPTYLPTSLHTYIHTCIHCVTLHYITMHACMHAYIHTCIHITLVTHRHTHTHTRARARRSLSLCPRLCLCLWGRAQIMEDQGGSESRIVDPQKLLREFNGSTGLSRSAWSALQANSTSTSRWPGPHAELNGGGGGNTHGCLR